MLAIPILAGLVLLVLALGEDGGQDASGSTRRRHRLKAVLVGIDRLPAGPVERQEGPPMPLECAEKDAAEFARFLRRRCGTAPGDVLLLQGKRAGRAPIERALRRHFADLLPGETALFYFSGHGTTLPDRGRDEPDGYDEALVTCDPPDPAGRTVGLTDDTLYRLFFSTLTGRGVEAVLILDCCHSGALYRSGGGRVKGFGPSRGCREPEETSPPLPAGAVGLFACGPGQEAREGRDRGLFTGFLLEELAGGAAADYADLVRRVRDRIRACADPLARQQFPLVRGGEAMALFAPTSHPGRPGGLVLATEPGGSAAWIDRGDCDSAWFFPGQRLALYRLDRGNLSSRRVGWARLAAVLGLKSRITGPPGSLEPGLVVLPLDEPAGDGAIRFALAGIEGEAGKRVAEWFTGRADSRLAVPGEEAPFTIRRVGGRLRIRDEITKRLIDEHREEPRPWSALVEDIVVWHRWRGAATGGGNPLLRYEIRKSSPEGWHPVQPRLREYTMRIGDRFRLRAVLARGAREEVHLYPFCLASNYEFRLLTHPARGRRLRPDWPVDLEIDVTEPAGLDRILLFTSPDPALADRFPDSSTRLRNGSWGDPTGRLSLRVDRLSVRVLARTR